MLTGRKLLRLFKRSPNIEQERNDAAANVRGGVAATPDGSTTLALPLGSGQVQVAAAPTDGAVIYQDSGTTVTASPTQGLVASPAGTTMRAADCTSVADCTKAPQ